MNSNDMMVFVDDWLEFFHDVLDRQFKDEREGNAGEETQSPLAMELLLLEGMRDAMSSILDIVSEDSATSSSEVEDNEEVEHEEEEGAGASTVHRPKKRKLVSLNANAMESRQTKIAVKTRETARLPKGALGSYTMLVKDVDETIVRLVR